MTRWFNLYAHPARRSIVIVSTRRDLPDTDVGHIYSHHQHECAKGNADERNKIMQHEHGSSLRRECEMHQL